MMLKNRFLLKHGKRHLSVKSQLGAYLSVEIIIYSMVVALMVAAAGVSMRDFYHDYLIKSSANQITAYQAALRNYVSVQSGLGLPKDASGSDITELVGTDWLKSSVCNGSESDLVEPHSDGYLSCAFPKSTKLRQEFVTRFSYDSATKVFDAQVILSKIEPSNPRDGFMFAARLEQNIHKMMGATASPMASTFLDIVSNEGLALASAAPSATEFGVLKLKVSNSPNTDSWLRTDGSNKMQATLDMNENEIIDVTAVRGFDGLLEIEADTSLQGNLQISEDLEVNGQAGVTGLLTARNDFDLTGDGLLRGNVRVQGGTGLYVDNNFRSQNAVIAQDLNVQNDAFVEADLTVGGRTRLQSNLKVGSYIEAAGLVQAQDFVPTSISLAGNIPVQSSAAIYYATIVNTEFSAAVVQKPNCTGAGLTPLIFGTLINTRSSRSGSYHGSWISTVDNGTSWSLRAREYVDTNYDGVPEEYNSSGGSADIQVITKCG
ncbi:MAG: hypothetical protein IBX55_01560 [Methyloprofundus sp.]|nr:hypothetical protein [Methyloprofundus sp.]